MSLNEDSIENDLKYVYKAQKEILLLTSVSMLLNWDQNTHMPQKAFKERSEQLKLIDGYISKKLTSQKLHSTLLKLKEVELDNNAKVVLNEFLKIVEKEIKIPKSLNKEITKQIAISYNALEKARKENNYNIFKIELQKNIDLKRKYSECLNPSLKPYDVLLSEYDDYFDSEKLTEIFSVLKSELTELFNKIKESENYKIQDNENIKLNKIVQRKIIKDFTNSINIPLDKISFDKSNSSFMMDISRFDVRIATSKQDDIDSLFSVIHEIGHALYVLGLPKEFKNTFLYDGPSISIHESQSLFWEYMIAKSEMFWEGYSKNLELHTNSEIKWQDIYKAINLVKPSAIRTSSNEITYCLQIIIRFEIERDLINGLINVENLNDIWNQKMQEVIGIVPTSDKEGILQDTHWADGDFGYFPFYIIGMIYASQIYKQAKLEIKDFDEKLKNFDLKPIVEWLRDNIHSKGKTLNSEQLIYNICKEEINPKILIEIFKEKYSKIYNLKN